MPTSIGEPAEARATAGSSTHDSPSRRNWPPRGVAAPRPHEPGKDPSRHGPPRRDPAPGPPPPRSGPNPPTETVRFNWCLCIIRIIALTCFVPVIWHGRVGTRGVIHRAAHRCAQIERHPEARMLRTLMISRRTAPFAAIGALTALALATWSCGGSAGTTSYSNPITTTDDRQRHHRRRDAREVDGRGQGQRPARHRRPRGGGLGDHPSRTSCPRRRSTSPTLCSWTRRPS